MDLDKRIEKGLNKIGIREFTQIQKDTYEPAVNGRNIIACSGTGTGKTFAYLIPVIMANIDNNSLYSVIIAPSKELCIQICSQINLISNNSGIPITAAALFGGVNPKRQLETLKSKPNIVVGTYQRIYELIKERRISAHQVKTFIIDEADRMLNKDNIDGILELRKCFMRDIQIMLFSASITASTEEYADMLVRSVDEEGNKLEFVKIFTSEKMTIPTNIEHIYFVVDKRDKIETVRKVIKALDTKHCMVFSNSKFDTEEITQKMEYHHYNAKCIHSDCTKNERRQIIDNFRTGKLDYLICSDIAARGMDFKNLTSIINIGLPDKPVDYLHRAGRCGRDGADSICASIITESELDKIKSIQKAFAVNIIKKKLYQGKVVKG